MVNSCAVTGCKKESYPGCHLSFHRLPANKERRELWITAMKLNSNVSKSACICGSHFLDEDYATVARTKLKIDAVPSILSKIIPEKSLSKASDNELNDASSQGDSNDDEIVMEPPTKKIKLADVSTQTKYNITPKETELRRHIQILKQRLRRRAMTIMSLRLIVQRLRNNRVIVITNDN